MRTVEDRRRAQRAGRGAETAAVWLLRLKGYRVLGRNLRYGSGEIDLVARRGRLLAFVEVKRRAGRGAAAEAVTGRQQLRVARAAAEFLARHPHLAGCDCRFDAILLVPRRWPVHIADAWRPPA